MPAPLIGRACRTPAVLAVGSALAVVAVLAVVVYQRTTTSFDTWVFGELYRHIDASDASTLLRLSSPTVSIVVPAAVAVLALALRRWDVAVLAVVAPATALVLTELVLKPLVGRLLGLGVLIGDSSPAVSGSYPSGHETGVASAALVLLIVLWQLPVHAVVRTVVATLLGAWMLLAAVGLVRNFYHYATDTIGALGVSTAVVLTTALLVDRCAEPVARRLGRRADAAVG